MYEDILERDPLNSKFKIIVLLCIASLLSSCWMSTIRRIIRTSCSMYLICCDRQRLISLDMGMINTVCIQLRYRCTDSNVRFLASKFFFSFLRYWEPWTQRNHHGVPTCDDRQSLFLLAKLQNPVFDDVGLIALAIIVFRGAKLSSCLQNW